MVHLVHQQVEQVDFTDLIIHNCKCCKRWKYIGTIYTENNSSYTNYAVAFAGHLILHLVIQDLSFNLNSNGYITQSKSKMKMIKDIMLEQCQV